MTKQIDTSKLSHTTEPGMHYTACYNQPFILVGFEESQAITIELRKRGYNAALTKLKLLGIAFVIERFSPMQKVEWDGIEYWVMEDNGEDKVLVANADETTHPEYNDWWVDRDKLNAL